MKYLWKIMQIVDNNGFAFGKKNWILSDRCGTDFFCVTLAAFETKPK
jgi:hypothetical protein